MPKRIEDEIRQRVEAMYEGSTPVENLLPTGFKGQEDEWQTKDNQIVLVPRPARRRQVPGWAVGVAAAAVVMLLVGVPLILLRGLETDIATPSSTLPYGTVNQTLYADGDISCPDLFADDTTRPAGQITYTPVPGGVEIQILLENAAPNWPYILYLQRPNSVDCGIGLDAIPFTTDAQGRGELTATLPLARGSYSIGVNISYDIIEPPDSQHREISTSSYATLTVP